MKKKADDGGKCDYCSINAQRLTGTPFIADGGKMMCKPCWIFTRDMYPESYIGEFKS